MTAILEPPRLPRTVPDWHEQGACQLFPELDFVEAKGAEEAACRIICAACPVRMSCAVGALERGEPWGMWGGLSRVDRKRVALEFGYPAPQMLPEHGENARYAKHGCRCHPCTAAHTLYESERRRSVRRRAREKDLWRTPIALTTPINRGRIHLCIGQLVIPFPGVPVPPAAAPIQPGILVLAA